MNPTTPNKSVDGACRSARRWALIAIAVLVLRDGVRAQDVTAEATFQDARCASVKAHCEDAAASLELLRLQVYLAEPRFQLHLPNSHLAIDGRALGYEMQFPVPVSVGEARSVSERVGPPEHEPMEADSAAGPRTKSSNPLSPVREKFGSPSDSNDADGFLWPPPEASGRTEVPDALLRNPHDTRLEHVNTRLSKALEQAGYMERSYFSVPGGFAVATGLEQIDQDGRPAGGQARWEVEVGPIRSLSLWRYLKALFGSDRGHFRVVVLVVTDQLFSASGAPVDKAQALRWPQQGANRLPHSVAQLPYTSQHACTALIYEFESAGSAKPPLVLIPGRLPGQLHLERTGILAKLGIR